MRPMLPGFMWMLNLIKTMLTN